MSAHIQAYAFQMISPQTEQALSHHILEIWEPLVIVFFLRVQFLMAMLHW